MTRKLPGTSTGYQVLPVVQHRYSTGTPHLPVDSLQERFWYLATSTHPWDRLLSMPRLRSVQQKCLLLGVIILALLYLVGLLWGVHQVTAYASLDDVTFPSKQSRIQPTIGSIALRDINHTQTSDAHRIVILLVSIPRIPETLCSTLQSVRDYFVDPNWEPPLVLIHRYGPGQSCTHLVDIFRQFPLHDRVTNNQQTLDYLHLMDDALSFQQKVQQSYVLFLDDDVTLCPGFPQTVSLLQQVAPNFTLAHLGRGGSGVLIPTSSLSRLRDSIQAQHHSFRSKRPKNIDKMMLEWGLDHGCTLRPTTVQMRHIGVSSRLHPGMIWNDIDQCGEPSNNRDWQALSETQFHPRWFTEHCVHSPYDHQNTYCSPYSSIPGTNCRCISGYTGQDCGIPMVQSPLHTYIRRTRKIVPLVTCLFATSPINSEWLQEQVLADRKAHSLINLYIIGNHSRRGWLSDNIYTTPLEPYTALTIELQNSSRFGVLAFPKELVILNQLLTPQELWTLKYYQVR